MLQSLLKCTDVANYSELMTDVPVSYIACSSRDPKVSTASLDQNDLRTSADRAPRPPQFQFLLAEYFAILILQLPY